ncbi:LysR family transcriptional regulator [Prescottella subtropica]|uniref:LysR family transcriptional regulator n=1 Tax=Prescottella subtropica TaxID=2545757 RepID=UPI0010F79B47|nr:LysR family transcriptional regulator [Prescottella subtropica]
MELRQLTYFVAVAEEANFTRAAARVHISQSGISAQIRQLENELGTPLFDRTARTAALTVAGKASLPHARAALAAARSVHEAVDDVNQLVRGQLSVGMVTACTVTPLFDALAACRRAHPGIGVDLVEDISDVLLDRVRTGHLDVALVGLAGGPPTDLDTLTVVSERITALVEPGHPLTASAPVRLADVCEHPLICMPVGTGVRTVLDRECAAAGIEGEVVMQASAPDAVADLAGRGLGVAILSTSMAAAYPHLVPVPIADTDVDAVLALVWKPAPSPALREFLRHAHRAFR